MILENNAQYEFVSVFNGMTKLTTIFAETPNEDDYLENALNCLRLIGNTYFVISAFQGTTDDEGKLCLPTDAYAIEAVTNGWQDWTNSSWRNKTSNLFISGNYLKYEYYYNNPLGTKTRYLLLRDSPNTNVQVLYRTYNHDENYLPLVTEAESEACAYYYKYIETLRKTFQGNANASQLLSLAEKMKGQKILQARAITHMSQNFVNDINNIIHSFDRKWYNRTHKPVKIA